MWTPLHFATYYGHLKILKYLIDDFGIACPFLCLIKIPADTEDDMNNSLKFIDDKMYALMLAFETNHLDVLKYLLDRFSKEWPTNTALHFLELRKEGYPHWAEAI